MDAPVIDTSEAPSAEVRPESLGEKRPFEDDVGTDSANKKARGSGEVKLAVCMKQVAEIVLVLATMGKMRAAQKPTPVEVKMMAEARGKLAQICKQFAPKDVFPTDAFGTIIEDLGFNRLKETKLGNLPQKMSISQKLQLAKQKMEKAEVFPLHSTTYTPRVGESRATPHAVQTVSPVTARSFQNHSSVVHASAASNSRTLPYQLPASEVRPVGSNVLTSSRLAVNSVGDGKGSSFNKAGLNNGQHLMNSGQPPAANTHNEVAKLVQKILQPLVPDRQIWNPPSRDYMSKALTCQTCKSLVNEVETVLVCDACEKGYHLRCLQCNPKSIFGEECREWHCAKCLAISNGKPLPLKYGRVMRNINTPQKPASSAEAQPSLEKKVQSSDENFNQRLMSANGDSGTQASTDVQISGTKPSTQNGIKLESNQKGENGENEEVVKGGSVVKTSENCTAVTENEGPLLSSMRDVEWVGGVINEVDGKVYYGSCCINGTTYKLQDYALFSFAGNNLVPNKIQSMWEDNKTNKKWVTVARCFFPDALPVGVGRPCAPESNEVYESNHETTLAAGLIHGPCEVLPPRKFSEERVIQNHPQTKTSDEPKQFFLCKWFYDEKKRLFRDVTC